MLPQTSPQILLTSAGRAWRAMEADYLHVPKGMATAPAGEMHGLGIHFGPPVRAECRCGGLRVQRVQKPGDIDIVPAGMAGSWEDDGDCRILRLSIAPIRLQDMVQELGHDPARFKLSPRFQSRDPHIEGIALAIRAELESEFPSDPLYIDRLADALAIRLIHIASSGEARIMVSREPGLSARQHRALTEFIEANLSETLHLPDLADVIGVSVTRLKTLFRNSLGMPVHQYVIRRRVEHARALIATTRLPASEIALAAGFAHQSHMISTMRRVLGQTPGEIARRSDDFRPNLQSSART